MIYKISGNLSRIVGLLLILYTTVALNNILEQPGMKTALVLSLLSCLFSRSSGYGKMNGKNGKAVTFPRSNILFGKIDKRTVESSSVEARGKHIAITDTEIFFNHFFALY